MFVEKYLQELRRARFAPRALARYVHLSARQSLEAGLLRNKALRGLTLVGASLLAFNLGLALYVLSALDHETARELFLGMTFWLAGTLVWILLHLGMMRDAENLPATGIGIPNTITVVRLLSIPAFFTFMTHEYVFAGTLAFVLGGCTDVLDGWVARHVGPRTHLGRMMDPMVDVLFNCGAVLTFALCDFIPWWLFVLVWVRYALLTFGATWIYLFRGPIRVEPTLLGRV
ncbi:MAG: hypothetical protein HKN21_09265, partial [Candidatus Eisenbacteria bacterium]|nr:hypothetical protein [Candidatus Eisenbacteria bacterium]